MKRIIAFTILLGFSFPAARALTVYDPAVHAQQIIGTAQEIAKFVEMINNQVQQIDQLTEQVETLHHYVELFGDPSTFAPKSIEPLTADLIRGEVGLTLGDLQVGVDVTASLNHTGNGLFSPVALEFTTPGGVAVERRQDTYRPVAAIQQTADNFLAVAADTTKRRTAIKLEIARTTEELRNASTDAEVQKISGVLVGLAAALQSTDHELSQATAAAQVQDVANRADERRQIEARREEQQAEFAEAVDAYGRTFRLMSDPVEFPVN